MDESVKLVLIFLSGPVFLGAVAAVWLWITRVYIPARQKEREVSTASEREQQRSRQVFGETQTGKAQDRQNDREDKYMDFLLASSDGMIKNIETKIDDTKAEVIALIIKVDAQASERDRLIIASMNQTIGGNAKIQTALIQLLKDTDVDVSAALTADLLATLSVATIDSPSVQTAQKVATDAAQAETAYTVEPQAADGGPKVIAIVEALPGKGEK